MHNSRPYFSAIAGLLLLGSVAVATDWPRFRGPNGSGVSEETTPTPVTWSPDKNLKWKVKLPGPGSSCPIIVGDKIFVTDGVRADGAIVWATIDKSAGRAGINGLVLFRGPRSIRPRARRRAV